MPITEPLLQKASDALPSGEITAVWLPIAPEGVIRVSKTIDDNEVSAYVDRFSGEIIKVDKIESTVTESSFGDRVFESFYPVHYGTFAGEASRILYVFVGLSPTILLITGFIMWWNRRPIKRTKKENCS
ncbi:PepSY domain-containing protein [Candidatus Gracilibacteria bacterium]|nr:PepSY domain-containing protein [Candidatus Gracilibacteria bacterium]NJM87427.1 PepSY domain-containing protein [Hydrococcus sp. RU_2_2]NJP18166.1 PepSY domain-containing protein [Hydrococcus sp. CRU_1_1]NJQ97046.1 PepSY domain-containing protein [Hydrococcus sp. CSU_1_8]